MPKIDVTDTRTVRVCVTIEQTEIIKQARDAVEAFATDDVLACLDWRKVDVLPVYDDRTGEELLGVEVRFGGTNRTPTVEGEIDNDALGRYPAEESD